MFRERGTFSKRCFTFCTTEVCDTAVGGQSCVGGGGPGGLLGGAVMFSVLSYDKQPWGRIISGSAAPCCCGWSAAMAITLTPPPALVAGGLAGLVTLEVLATADAPLSDTPESLGARDGGDERTESLSGIELRGRIVGSFFMNAST